MRKRVLGLSVVILSLTGGCSSQSNPATNSPVPMVAGAGSNADGGGGSFPQALCVPNTTGGIVLNVMNTTPLLVQVTLAGPTRATAAVQPGTTQTLALVPGNYTVTGAAPSAPNATFVPSAWSVANGCDYFVDIKAST